MTVDEALEWAAKNCGEEAAQRLRSRAAAKALAITVLQLRDRLAAITVSNQKLRGENSALNARLDKFKGLDDSLEIEADLAYNALKNSGWLQQLESNRALAEQLKWGE